MLIVPSYGGPALSEGIFLLSLSGVALRYGKISNLNYKQRMIFDFKMKRQLIQYLEYRALTIMSKVLLDYGKLDRANSIGSNIRLS